MESIVSLTDIMQFKTKMQKLPINLFEKIISGYVFDWEREIVRSSHDIDTIAISNDVTP